MIEKRHSQRDIIKRVVMEKQGTVYIKWPGLEMKLFTAWSSTLNALVALYNNQIFCQGIHNHNFIMKNEER